MPAKRDSKYTLELVSPAGLLLAELNGLAKSRKLTKSRNEADEISWNIDLNDFEKYAFDHKIDPTNLIILDQTECRIRRGENYLSGGQISYAQTDGSADSETIMIKASGFLNLFAKRYTDALRVFENTEATTIGWTLIDESQSLPNGNFGITQGVMATVGQHDIKTYQRTNLKNALQDLTALQTNPFDMEFTYNKIFNTYAHLGTQRPEIIFEYPGNIKSYSIPVDGSGVVNEVTALGAGLGEEAQVQSVRSDLTSQADYLLRQEIITPNGIITEAELQDKADAELAAWAFPFEIPRITVDGNIAPFITDYIIGDYVRAKINNHLWLAHIDRMYRVEKFDLNIDDEDNEEVVLYLSA